MYLQTDKTFNIPFIDFEYEKTMLELIEGFLRGFQLIENKYSANHQSFYDWLYEELNFEENTNVLDYGSAFSHFWSQNKNKLNELTAYHLVDPSNIGMRFSNQVCKELVSPVYLNQMNLCDLSYEDEYFDTIFSDIGFRLVKKDQRLDALTEVNRVLKSKGKFSFVLADWPKLHNLQSICESYGIPASENKTSIEKKKDNQELFKLLEDVSFETVTVKNHTITYELNDAKLILSMILGVSHLPNVLKEIIQRNKVADFTKYIQAYISKHGAIQLTREVTLVTCVKA